MKNIAYTEEYLAERKRQSAVYCPDYLQHEKQVPLSDGYMLNKRSYMGKVGEYTRNATENDLLNAAGVVVYTYQNLNDDGDFCKIIEHRDGSSYMVFRCDLYGYSVLNLATLQEFHYLPPEPEPFIWTDVFYNKDNNMLAVSGCYWACPFGTLLQDFTKPMDAPIYQVDIQKHIKDGYDRYDDIDFVRWHGTDLHLSLLDIKTEKPQSMVIAEKEYNEWLKMR